MKARKAERSGARKRSVSPGRSAEEQFAASQVQERALIAACTQFAGQSKQHGAAMATLHQIAQMQAHTIEGLCAKARIMSHVVSRDGHIREAEGVRYCLSLAHDVADLTEKWLRLGRSIAEAKLVEPDAGAH